MSALHCNSENGTYVTAAFVLPAVKAECCVLLTQSPVCCASDCAGFSVPTSVHGTMPSIPRTVTLYALLLHGFGCLRLAGL